MRAKMLTVLALTVGTACGDSPQAPFGSSSLTVGIAAATTGVQYESAVASVICDVSVTGAVAGSKSGASAQWGGGKLRLFRGADRTKAVDSMSFTATEIAQRFGGTLVLPGITVRTSFRLRQSLPFEGEFQFRYLGSGEEKTTAPARFSCGPQPRPGSGPPVISNVSILPATAEVPVGERLRVSYTARAPAGLWYAQMQIRGAFDAQQVVRSPELGATGDLHFEQSIVIHQDSRLDTTMTVTLVVTDAAGVTTTLGPILAPQPADTVTPRILSLALFPQRQSLLIATGDPLHVSVDAVDGLGVISAVVYRLSGDGWSHQDSVGYNRGSATPISTSTAGPGPAELTVWAKDLAGNRSEPATLGPGIEFYPRVQRETRIVDLPGYGLSVAGVPGTLYVATYDQPLVRLPIETLRPQVVLPAGGQRWIDVSQDQRWLWTTTGGLRVVVYDLESESRLGLMFTPPAQFRSVHVAASGLAFSADVSGTGGVWEFSPTAARELFRAPLAGAAGGSRTASGSVLQMVLHERCVLFYDSDSAAFSPCVALPPVGIPETMDSSGTLTTRGMEVYRRDGSLVGEMHGGTFTLNVTAISPDGRLLYAASSAGIDQIRIADGKVLARIPIPDLRPEDLFSPLQMFFLDERTLIYILPGRSGRFYRFVVIRDPSGG